MDLESRNQCRCCGGRFPGLVEGRCLGCHDKHGSQAQSDEREALLEYVRRNPGASIATIARDTGASPGLITRLMGQNRMSARIDDRCPPDRPSGPGMVSRRSR